MRLTNTLLLAAGLACAGSALASDAAVEYRQNQMKVLGGHMGSIVALVKGEVSHPDQLALHAQGLAATAALTEAVFKEKAMNGKSAAKPAIWDDWQRFAASSASFTQAADKLAAAVAANDQGGIRAALAEVGKACKGCHDDFKNKR